MKDFIINRVAQKTAVSKYLAEIGRKGGKASGKARMEKLTSEQRVAVAKTAASARWAKSARQVTLQRLNESILVSDIKAQPSAEEMNLEPQNNSSLKKASA